MFYEQNERQGYSSTSAKQYSKLYIELNHRDYFIMIHGAGVGKKGFLFFVTHGIQPKRPNHPINKRR